MNRLRRVPARLAASALVCAVAAGCTTTSAGEPRPQDGGGSDPTSTIEGLPPRPSEITLDDVDPCGLVPEADYSDFRINDPGDARTGDDDNAQCLWNGTDVGYIGIVLDVTEGIENRLNGSYTVVGEVTDPVLGFGAVTYPGADPEKTCFVSVDAADGQQLTVQAAVLWSEDLVPPVCEYAHDFATSAMGTLVE